MDFIDNEAVDELYDEINEEFGDTGDGVREDGYDRILTSENGTVSEISLDGQGGYSIIQISDTGDVEEAEMPWRDEDKIFEKAKNGEITPDNVRDTVDEYFGNRDFSDLTRKTAAAITEENIAAYMEEFKVDNPGFRSEVPRNT